MHPADAVPAASPDAHARSYAGVRPHALDGLVGDVARSLKDLQKDDGHWCFELEADATIPAEYILLNHFLGEPEPALEAKMAAYLRRIQGAHGGWPLFHGGDVDISASVKAYFALKIVGDSIDAPHMKKAREAILARGGAARANVFTRMALALFGQVPWRAVPVMPVEIMLLPKWFPFHLDKVSYWSRTVIVPLLVLIAKKPQAVNPRRISIAELFVTPPHKERRYNHSATGKFMGSVFLGIDNVLRVVEPRLSKKRQQRAIDAAMRFVKERLNGEDGLGGIFPAMANAVMAYTILGYPKEHPDLIIARQSIRKLVVEKDDEAYCQPCLSPVWDTGLAALALLEAGETRDSEAMKKIADWLLERQITDVRGDWAVQNPTLPPGGWAFQYWNDHYPDVDDTAVVAMALDRMGDPKYQPAIKRAAEWIIGMQSKDGGWGAFDIDNNRQYLNHIPFADHGALLDPSTADVSARCVSFLCQIGYPPAHPVVARGLAFLRREQEDDGSWFGRWGTNYIYGTWSVLCAFNAAGEDMAAPHIQKAVAYLKKFQQADGGWGEDGASYWEAGRGVCKASTPSQTAWATLGLMAAGQVGDAAVARGIDYLQTQPRDGAKWHEEWFTAVGFPKVFYLRYHGYSAYFPLWAIARYRNLNSGNATAVAFGM